MPSDELPDWERVLSAAARLQEIIPAAVLDGIETGVRQLIRSEPLETRVIEQGDQRLTIPTEAEILRIKGALILKRNATRDYVDFVALAEHLGDAGVISALRDFDRLYPQGNDESALQQLQIQLATPLPYDLAGITLAEYRDLEPQWHDWQQVAAVCQRVAVLIFDRIVGSSPA